MTLPTTLFVIDDDDAVLRRITKESLAETNLGILTSENIPSAVQHFESYPIGALLIDLHFRRETQDPEHELYGGLDFAKYCFTRRPSVPIYVFSADANARRERERAEELGIKITGWYDKLSFGAGQLTPWKQIERHLLVKALSTEPEMRDRVISSGGDPAQLMADERVAERLQEVFSYPRLTYISQLPQNCSLTLLKPILAHIWPKEGGYLATAVEIPLLTEASGEDAVEAIENLVDLILYEKFEMDKSDPTLITGYAGFIRDRLNAHLSSNVN